MKHLEAPAGYWRPPFNHTVYLETNTFLADINNEREQKNATYRRNMVQLNTLALSMATKDSVVIPQSSPLFSFFANNSDSDVVPWNETKGYEEDWVGLRTLHESGRLITAALPCTHMGLKEPACKPYSYDGFARPLLNNTLPRAVPQPQWQS
ncbi:hypothetical protein PTSG_07698 [Salpingoeca rosetta]|uniref:Uncharacterized protein n=1 Tax=Salpingoeca rosetta (strain ATCC 50818 / BSB-021) TaxID=946362 RepID=F2UHI2_SALR5|nr:uncharacterized protein PTSG_07698 [Salpingoeca rosetta]EGD76581.1 hypothetical protein PTSG_07698 [Salpingoeca rosetta]|eukprot:XP_004991495.1 hypothetical protein PTSG_07698 [Salpingoeca rosetta]